MGRVISYSEKTGYNDGDYLLLDNGEGGTKRIRADRVGIQLDPTLTDPNKSAPANAVKPVDAVPTQGSSNAVSSGGVYTELLTLKEELTSNTGISRVTDWVNGCYVTSAGTTTVDVTTPSESTSFTCSYRACKEGDIFYYTGYGTDYVKPWAFLDAIGAIIERAPTSGGTTFTKEKVVAPEGSAYIVFNASISHDYKTIVGGSIADRFNIFEEEHFPLKYVSTPTNISYIGKNYVNDSGALINANTLYMYKLLCVEGQEVRYLAQTHTSYYAISFFNSSDVFISGVKASSATERITAVAPKGTVYCYLIAYTDNLVNIFNRTRLYAPKYHADVDGFYIPSHWDDEIATSETAIRNHEITMGEHGVEFFFVTDTHWLGNAQQSGEIIAKMSKDLNIPLVVFGGDAVYSRADSRSEAIEELRDFYDAYNKDFYLFSTIGNHDYNYVGSSDTTIYTTDGDLYAVGCRRMEDFAYTDQSARHAYYDNTSQKVRYIQVNCANNQAITNADLEWVDARITELDAGWTAILFSHSYFSSGASIPTACAENAEHFATLNESADATIACWIVGHCHMDTSDDTHGILVISTSCDVYNQSTQNGGPEMAFGTDTEQCIDCYQIDTSNRKIYVTRIGAGDDREFTYA